MGLFALTEEVDGRFTRENFDDGRGNLYKENENPVIPIADAWGETRNNCQPFPYGSYQFMQRSAACDKLTAGWASFEAEYNNLLVHFKTEVLAPENINPLLDAWITQIRDATIEASATHGDAITVTTWSIALSKFRDQLEYARIH